jgi:hypothetical protein
VGEYLQELEREAGRLPWNARQELLEDVRSHIEVATAESDAAELEGDRAGRIRRILAALGEPREIVDAAASDEPPLPPPPPPGYGPPFDRPRSDPPRSDPPPFNPYGPAYQYPTDPGPPPYPLGPQEIFAIMLLLIGGFLLVIGWFIGVALLWTSSRWRLRERLIGTFVLPGGVAGALFFGDMAGSGESCGSSSSDPVSNCASSGSWLSSWWGFLIFVLCLVTQVVTAFYLARQARSRRPSASVKLRRSSGATSVIATVVGALLLIVVTGTFFALVAGNGKGGGSGGTVTPVSSPVAPQQSPPLPVYSPSVFTASTSP